MHLELTDVCKAFVGRAGVVWALKNINLHVETGEFICLVGASGSGKSTLLRLVAGLETLTSGVIAVDGQQVVGPGSDRGMVFQHSTLYPWLTIQKNVEFGLKLQGYPKAERWERASVYLDMVGLTEFREAYPKQLSGDMKQRAAIAKALVCEPKILLMDEPFSALDGQTKEAMQQFLLEVWQRTGTSMMMITHDVAEAVFLSQRVYVLSRQPGRVRHEFRIDLPVERTYKLKRQSEFRAYQEAISDLIRDTRSSIAA
jgi:NitT/TauT family transport system ATP-binding protein